MVRDNSKVRGPLLHLSAPIGASGIRNNDQERPAPRLMKNKGRDKADDLDSLAKTHLVGEDTILLDLVVVEKPVDAFHLVLHELSSVANSPNLLLERDLLPSKLVFGSKVADAILHLGNWLR